MKIDINEFLALYQKQLQTEAEKVNQSLKSVNFEELVEGYKKAGYVDGLITAVKLFQENIESASIGVN